MKMFVIVYSWASDELVLAALDRIGVKSYTKLTKAKGYGTETEPKLETHFAAGENDILAIVVRDEEADKVRNAVLSLRKEYPREGIRCFILPVEEMI